MGCSFRRRFLSAHAISVMTKGIDDKSRECAETIISFDTQENRKKFSQLKFFDELIQSCNFYVLLSLDIYLCIEG